MSNRSFILILLACPLLASSYRAQLAQEGDLSAGDIAAPGRWLAPGGDAAHSGRSTTRAIRRTPEVAWKIRLRGRIEAEPSTWDGSVILSVLEGPGRRALHVLDMESGRTLLHQTLSSTQPLSPMVFGDTVCVQTARDRLDLYRMRAGRLHHARTIRARKTLSPAVLIEGQLYLSVDDRLQRIDLDQNEPVWESSVRGAFRGRPALSGQGVFALLYDERGNASIASFERATGRLVSRTMVGHHGGEVPAVDEQAELFVFGHRIFVRFPRPVPSSSGRGLGYGRLERDGLRLASKLTTLQDFAVPPLAWGTGWVVLDGSEEARWLWAEEQPEGIAQAVLADETHHVGLTRTLIPATRAGSVLYLGGLAAELETGRILWKRTPPLFRAVPSDGFLLVVEDENTITALREQQPERSASLRTVEKSVEQLEERQARGFALLAQRSIQVGDVDLSRRLLNEALRRGAEGRPVEEAYLALERIAASSRTAHPESNLYRGLKRAEDLLREQPVRELHNLARSTSAPAVKRGYLRAVLERDPLHAESLSLVRGMVQETVPGAVSAAQPFPGLSWLDFLDVHARTPVTFLGGSRSVGSSADRALLKRVAGGWRRELIGYRSDRLFVVTPPGRPGAVARCLEVGELVCNLLEELFEGDRTSSNRRGASGESEPMLLLLYENRAEYIAESRRDASGPEAGLDWTAGHYSSRDNKSRMYVPEDDADLENLLGIYAHELTHHWLATRAPFASRGSDARLPFWIVEGFAKLIEEFQLDPRNNTWDSENPRAASLDVIACIEPRELLPWSRVLTMSHEQFSRLEQTAKVSVPLTWSLGLRREQSEVQLFYAQASAIAHYLHNSGAANRKRLTDYLAAWYRQDAASLSASRAFGLTAAALGERVIAHARAAVGN